MIVVNYGFTTTTVPRNPSCITMALRNFLSRALLPNFERDLSRTLTAEMESASTMVDSMLAPSVFGYKTASAAGAFQTTHLRSAPVVGRVVKVHYDAGRRGMFQDRESWHHMKTSSSL